MKRTFEKKPSVACTFGVKLVDCPPAESNKVFFFKKNKVMHIDNFFEKYSSRDIDSEHKLSFPFGFFSIFQELLKYAAS